MRVGRTTHHLRYRCGRRGATRGRANPKAVCHHRPNGLYKKFAGTDVSDEIIELSTGFTGSHVVETVNTAKILAAYNNLEVNNCLTEACNIIRSNFFPGQTVAQTKEAVKKSIGMEKSSGDYYRLVG